MLSKTWDLGSQISLRVTLKREEWLTISRFCDAPTLTYEKAGNIRLAVTLAPKRVDYRDRWCYSEPSPFVRIAKQQFREDGLLLPFGSSRVGFNTPNPYVACLS